MQTTTRRTQNLILFLGIIVLFCTVSLFATNTAFMVTNEIYHGVVVGDIPVGGLTPSEAEAKIVASLKNRNSQPWLIMEYQGTNWTIMAEDIDLNISAKMLTDQAYNVGRNGNILYQFKERYLTINRGYKLPLAISYNTEKLNRIITEIAKTVARSPRNASIRQEGSQIRIVPETIGIEVEIDRTIAEVTNRLNSQISPRMQLPVTEVAPNIRSADLSDIDGIIASYSTQFDSSDTNRSQNIHLAAISINGTLVKAGSEFSFNGNVGPRLAQNGYKEAPVFIEGKLVPDFGGGVCQVSSTLYNAVLLADLTVSERTAHFRPPGYVPLGQDATVADNLLDFKFKNTGPNHIYITSDVIDNQLTITIYGGKANNKFDIKVVPGEKRILEPNTIIKQDSSMDMGKQIVEVEGQKGFYITTYRIKSLNGQEVEREFLSTDEFKAVERVIRIGTKLPAPTK